MCSLAFTFRLVISRSHRATSCETLELALGTPTGAALQVATQEAVSEVLVEYTLQLVLQEIHERLIKQPRVRFLLRALVGRTFTL